MELRAQAEARAASEAAARQAAEAAQQAAQQKAEVSERSFRASKEAVEGLRGRLDESVAELLVHQAAATAELAAVERKLAEATLAREAAEERTAASTSQRLTLTTHFTHVCTQASTYVRHAQRRSPQASGRARTHTQRAATYTTLSGLFLASSAHKMRLHV